MTATSEQERVLIGPADVDAAVAQARAVFDDGAWARDQPGHLP